MKTLRPLFALTMLFAALFVSPQLCRGAEISDSALLRVRYAEPADAAEIVRFEIYVTTDGGKKWILYDQKAPNTKFYFDVDLSKYGDGVYGLKIATFNEAGIASNKPSDGDAPDWVEIIDTTKPTVSFQNAQQVIMPMSGEPFVIKWVAADANFGEKPIKLEYTFVEDGKPGDWIPLLDTDDSCTANTGSETVKFPPVQSEKNIMVQITAFDRVGHRTTAPIYGKLQPAIEISKQISGKSLTLPNESVKQGVDTITISWRVAGVPNATAALYVRRPGTNREYIPIEATSNPTIVYKLSPSDPDGIYQFYLGVKDADNFEVGGPFQPTFKTEPMEEITVDRTLPKVTVSALALFEDNGDAAVVEEPGVFRGGKNLRISWIVDDESPLAKVEPMHIEVSFDGGNSFTSLVGWAYLKVKENTDAPKKRQWNGEYIWKLPRLGSESHLLLKISAFDVVKNEGIGYSKKFRIRSFAPKKEDDVLAEEYLRKGRMFRDSKGDPDNLRKARNYFEDSLRYSKDDPETLLELAHVLRKLGEIKEALRVAERAKAKSNSYMLHHTLAVLYIDDGQLHDAGLEVEELLKAQSAPNLTNDEIKSICKLIIELADRCEQAGDLDAAVQYLTKITDNMSASVVEYYMNKAKDKINELNARLGSKRSDKGGDERFDD